MSKLSNSNSVAHMCEQGASFEEVENRLGPMSEVRYKFEMREAIDRQKNLLKRMQHHAYTN